MTRIVSRAVYHTKASQDARKFQLEVLAHIIYLHVGKSRISLPVSKLKALIELAIQHDDAADMQIEEGNIVPKDESVGISESGLLHDGQAGAVLDVPKAN